MSRLRITFAVGGTYNPNTTTTTIETEGEVGAVKSIEALSNIDITDRSKVVLLIWLSVFACFGDRVCTDFTFCLFRRYLFRLRLFGRELLIRFTVCSLCIF